MDVSCGEVDPFVIGDTCVILISDEANNLTGVMAEFDDFSQYDGNWNNHKSLIGEKAIVRKGCLIELNKAEHKVMSENYSWEDKKVEIKRLKETRCFKLTN